MMARMSGMMFLQYFPFGVWGVTIGTYIGANTGQQGSGIFSAGFIGYSTAASAIGSLLSPVVMGFLSDRYFAAQRLVSALNFGCAIAAWGMNVSQSQAQFFLWIMLYFQCFVPAATLTNKISLKHLANSDAEYPLIRVFGTAGWIISGLLVGILWPLVTGESIEATRTPLVIACGGHFVMALFALTLPHTPPERSENSGEKKTWRERGVLLTNAPLVAFLLVSMLACVPSMAYNNFANPFLNYLAYPAPAALMTLGQISDLICLAAAPWLIARFGLRSLFATGILAWTVRYLLLAAGSYFSLSWPVIAAIMIHGPCYVFIYVVGVMFVDHLAEHSHRGAAQGLYALATTGIGHLAGAFTVGFAQSIFLTPAGVAPPPYNWTAFWLVPAAIGILTIIALQLALRRPPNPGETTSAKHAA
jgi:nucleoside transporter